MKLYYIVLSQTAVRKKGYDVTHDDHLSRGLKSMYFTFEIIKWNIFIMHEQEGYV